MDHPHDSRQAGAGIEVTPEMIDAGVIALEDSADCSASWLAQRAYQAMELIRLAQQASLRKCTMPEIDENYLRRIIREEIHEMAMIKNFWIDDPEMTEADKLERIVGLKRQAAYFEEYRPKYVRLFDLVGQIKP